MNFVVKKSQTLESYKELVAKDEIVIKNKKIDEIEKIVF